MVKTVLAVAIASYLHYLFISISLQVIVLAELKGGKEIKVEGAGQRKLGPKAQA